MAEDKAPELSQALKSAGYTMKNGVQPGPAMIQTPGGGWMSVDFRTMQPDQADELIAMGYKDIAKESKAKASSTNL